MGWGEATPLGVFSKRRFFAHAVLVRTHVGLTVERALSCVSRPPVYRRLTLRAACDCFGCVVHVVTTEHDNWLLHYVPSKLDGTFNGL